MRDLIRCPPTTSAPSGARAWRRRGCTWCATPDRVAASWPDVLRAAIAGGVDIVQLRDKRLSDDELTAVAQTARTLCAQLGALLIVNDRPHGRLKAGADGVHVGQEDMPVAQVRELIGPEMLIGLSTHAPAEIDAADGSGRCDRRSASRRGQWRRRGLHRRRTRARNADQARSPGGRPGAWCATPPMHARVPFFAIGGIDRRQPPRSDRGRGTAGGGGASDRKRRPTPSGPHALCGWRSTCTPGRTSCKCAIAGA